MAIKAVLTALALCLCIQFIFADKMVWLTNDESATLSPMCPNKPGYSQTPMPPDSCEIESYLGCQDGKARQKIQCPEGKFYNRTTGWCEPAVNITWPPGCTVPANKPWPRNCNEVTVKPDTVPVSYTCSMYIACDQTGDYVMPCQKEFWYYPPKKQCISRNAPYAAEMPEDFQKSCRDMENQPN